MVLAGEVGCSRMRRSDVADRPVGWGWAGSELVVSW